MPIIDRVCPECSALDGRQIGMDELFFSGNRVEYDESGLYPPLHPRCACAVQYVEVEAPRYDSAYISFNTDEFYEDRIRGDATRIYSSIGENDDIDQVM